MALLGSYIDSRTLAALASGGSSSYAHGLPAAPDLVVVQENTTTDSTSNIKLVPVSDATNVTVWNHGQIDTATLRAVAIRFHSVVR